ncbi:uncharacterized protein IWZ02DRAFT_5081 [Phyllosticta citriasiana]|uniref:uncharacterized protein n=1 Tax=Phyllosticta citriasiana TaxID=595635 RepID=UPI0030FDE30B
MPVCLPACLPVFLLVYLSTCLCTMTTTTTTTMMMMRVRLKNVISSELISSFDLFVLEMRVDGYRFICALPLPLPPSLSLFHLLHCLALPARMQIGSFLPICVFSSAYFHTSSCTSLNSQPTAPHTAHDMLNRVHRRNAGSK